MRVRIRHTTTFRYAEPASGSFNELRLTPRNDERQNLLSFRLHVSPRARTTEYRDHFGTRVHAFNVWPAHDELSVVGESTVVSAARETVPDGAGAFEALEEPAFRDAHAEWLYPSPLASGGDHLMTFAQHVRRVVRPASVLALVTGASHEVHRRFTYATGASYVTSTVDDLLERGTGVCQDFAHLLIGLCRSIGIPARYVSGYTVSTNGSESGAGIADTEASHAWAEAYTPMHGWRGFDPTNDLVASTAHIKMAIGRDYADVPPTRGTFRGQADERLTVTVDTRQVE